LEILYQYFNINPQNRPANIDQSLFNFHVTGKTACVGINLVLVFGIATGGNISAVMQYGTIRVEQCKLT